MVRRAIPVSGMILVSSLLAVLGFVLLTAVCRMRDCTCTPRVTDTISFKDTTTGPLAVNAVTGLLYAVEHSAFEIAYLLNNPGRS